MKKTNFNAQHHNRPASESEAIDWIRSLDANSLVPVDVVWRIAQAIRYLDARITAHEQALIAAASAPEPAPEVYRYECTCGAVYHDGVKASHVRCEKCEGVAVRFA